MSDNNKFDVDIITGTILVWFIPCLKHRSSFLTACILSILSPTKVRDFVNNF